MLLKRIPGFRGGMWGGRGFCRTWERDRGFTVVFMEVHLRFRLFSSIIDRHSLAVNTEKTGKQEEKTGNGSILPG